MWITSFRRGIVRGFSTSGTASKCVSVAVESFTERSKLATVNINGPPVNCLKIPLALELTQTLKDLEVSKDVDALVIKSSIPGVFSAGLDLKDLHGQPPQHLQLLWKSVQDFWLQLYSSRLATVAYISGHCLAAGVIMAGACDYRFGVDGNYKLGIPTARIGMVAPPWVAVMLSHIIGRRQTARSLQIGQTFSPQEALEIKLLDSLSAPDSASADCFNVLHSYLSVSQESRSTAKRYMRTKFIDEFECSKAEDLASFVEYVMRESVQKNLGDYMEGYKNKG